MFEEGEINWTGELQKMTDNLKEVEMEAGVTAAIVRNKKVDAGKMETGGGENGERDKRKT